MWKTTFITIYQLSFFVGHPIVFYNDLFSFIGNDTKAGKRKEREVGKRGKWKIERKTGI